jgi:hypothetical protein
MLKFLHSLIAVVFGFVLGSVVNKTLFTVGVNVFPPLAGAEVTTVDGLMVSLARFEPRPFIFPFLAHVFGTLVGVLLASWLAPGRSRVPAYIVGGLFLFDGIANAFLLPPPAWFIATDLLLAYLPAAWAGRALANRMSIGSISSGA